MVETLETLVDEAAAENPSPGSRAFQRLNRAEYQASIRALLNLDVDAGDYLPLDTRGRQSFLNFLLPPHFDNMADASAPPPLPTLLDAYLKAAAEISRLAVGDPGAPLQEQTYTNPGYLSQMDHIPGTPFGTRGGILGGAHLPRRRRIRLPDRVRAHPPPARVSSARSPGMSSWRSPSMWVPVAPSWMWTSGVRGCRSGGGSPWRTDPQPG